MGSITGSELLAKSLKAQGMDTLFYLMGGPMLETESACIKLGVRAIDSRHEQGAAMMAHAYSRLTRRPGVCMASSGPGTINMATGVANAFVDAAPLVAVGGTSPRVYFGMDAFQEVDQLSLYKPITKWATRILDAKRIPDVVATSPATSWVRWSRNRPCRCRLTGGRRPALTAIPRRSARRSRCSRAPSGP
jgi:acetolactate synthase-1/2/3 large subunit